MKIVYCTPSLYIAGGIERVLTSKANYLASQGDKYDVTIILTDGYGKEPFYHLSDKVRLVNLNIGFEELWELSFFRKIPVYLKKQRLFKRRLTEELMRLKPDITVSTLRREINFITDIPDGSKKIGEIHINRQNYRNFSDGSTSPVKRLFAKWWMWRLTKKLKRLDKFVVLTEEDMHSWQELDNVCVIPNPLPFVPAEKSALTEKRVIAVGRYSHEKGIDLLLRAWSIASKELPGWRLCTYGTGNREPYLQLARELHLDESQYELCSAVENIGQEYLNSSLFVLSSRFEGFGMALVEAMSYGLAAVAFNCPTGPKHIISNGKDGILVENGNIQELANTLVRVAGNSGLMTSLGHEAAQTAQRFAIGEIGRRWEELFHQLAPHSV